MSHAIQKRIKQLQQQLKAAHLDRKTLQIIAPQFQNNFALLRFLLFRSDGNMSPDDNSPSHSTIQPTNRPNPIFVDTLPTTVDEPSTFRFISEGAMGPPRKKIANFAITGFQSSLNTREAPPTTMQNLTSRISKLEKLFADEIALYTCFTA